MKANIKEIETKDTTEKEVRETIKSFLKVYKAEGVNLRMENTRSIAGRRIVIVFDYDDIG